MDATVVAVAILAWLSLLWVFFPKPADKESETDRLETTVKYIQNDADDFALRQLETVIRMRRMLLLFYPEPSRTIE